MKKSVLKLLALLPFCAAAQSSYEIKGKVGNLNDPYKVYLVYKVNGQIMLDSSRVQDGVYQFRGRMDSVRPAGLVLSSGGFRSRTSATADMRTFYLGNDSYTVTSADSMRSSAITGSRINDSAMLAALKETLQNMQVPKEWRTGDAAPMFEQPDSAGKMIRLADYHGKMVLVDFWASWCGPCRAESPNLVKAYRKYHPKGLEMISISVDDAKNRRAWLDAVLKDNMTWINASDLRGGLDNAAATAYAVKTIPQNFLIDGEGKIIATNLLGEALDKKLEEVYSQKR